MIRDTNRFTKQNYDVLVIGGGINGAAIAHIASANGLQVALVEKNDFASGASSKSTKLIHGGLRYLEQFEFDLVYEALKERSIQLKNAAHLVKPLGFIIPLYKNDRRPLWKMRVGIFLYDLLSVNHLIKRHNFLNRDQVLQRLPGIKQDGLAGGILYYDAQMDDARLCLENVLSAEQKGAHIANYTKVTAFLKVNGKVTGVKAVDCLTQNEFEIKAKKIICAVGPWANELRKFDFIQEKAKMRTTKGVHVVYNKPFSSEAILIQSGQDDRILFIIPWNGQTLIGTTDTDYAGAPDNVSTEPEDIRYLITEVEKNFPDIKIKQEDIITTFAGLRPLVFKDGAPSKISRKHLIEQSFSGIYYVMGGKYTTYRKIAEECLQKVFPNRSITAPDPYHVYGSGTIKENPEDLAISFEVPVEVVKLLMAKYGRRYSTVLSLIKDNPRFKERICACSSAILAQVEYSIKVEMARRPEDIIWRRLGIGFNACETKQCQKVIEEYFKK